MRELLMHNFYLKRPRLDKLFEETLNNHSLIVICAGMGYGKTQAFASFLQESDARSDWVQLSERDNNISYFWEKYTNIAAASFPELETALKELGFPDTAAAFSKYAAIVDNLAAVPTRHVYVMDDFHFLKNPAIVRHVERTAHTLPVNANIIIISRTLPQISAVISEQAAIISEDNLRFTKEEICAYLRQLHIPSSSQYVQSIYNSTQGWAFAVNLAARSLKNAKSDKQYTLRAMKGNIFKLIDLEIFTALSDELQRFLVRLSLIEHLNADLVKNIAGDEALVSEMEGLTEYIRYDLFLNAYFIHSMFLDFLRQRQGLLTEEEKRDTYQKAGEWCETNGYHSNALEYYSQAVDYSAIIRTFNRQNRHIPQDVARCALKIFENAPETAAFENPWFPVTHLRIAISMWQPEKSMELAKRYISAYLARPESPEKNWALSWLYGSLGTLRLFMCTYTDVYDFDRYFQKQAEYHSRISAPTEGPPDYPIGAWALYVGTNRPGAIEEYIGALSRSISYVSVPLGGFMCGWDNLVRGELCFFRQEIDEAEKYIKQVIVKAQSCGQYYTWSYALIYLMRIAIARGNLHEAETVLQEMDALLDKSQYSTRYAIYDILAAFYYLSMGLPELIPDWLKQDFKPYVHPACIEGLANQVRANYHFQTRQYEKLLNFIESEHSKKDLLLSRINAFALKALSLFRMKKQREAIAALTEAYRLAEPERIIFPFSQYAKNMRALTFVATRSPDCAIPREWLEKISCKSSVFAKRQAHMLEEFRRKNGLDCAMNLSPKEKKVLYALSQGVSRAEIAASQNISAGMVRNFINSIYDKLGVDSLSSAVRIAVQQGIL
jgi:LuxR family maltose regulon positive regulatory protein